MLFKRFLLLTAPLTASKVFQVCSFNLRFLKYQPQKCPFFLVCTGCDSHFRNPVVFNILKEPLLVQKQTLHQQKVLDLSFNLAPWKWAWHCHEAATPSCPKITFFTSRAPMLFAARGRDALLIMPRPLSGCQIKAEIKGFLLMYHLFLYY